MNYPPQNRIVEPRTVVSRRRREKLNFLWMVGWLEMPEEWTDGGWEDEISRTRSTWVWSVSCLLFGELVSWEMTNLTLGHDNSGVWRNAF